MNKPVRHISVFVGVLVLALLVQATWVQFVRGDELAEHKQNKRVRIASFAQPRGNIIVGGQPITGASETSGDYKYKRTFKDAEMYAPVTGYSSQIYGNSQLEFVNDKLLSGTDDRLFLQRTTDMLTGKKPRGGDVVTTINPKAQKAAFEGLGKYKGAVVALDPRTGKVLALASTPSYDPSVFAGNTYKDQKAWDALAADKNKPTLNRALKERYPPGSTFKILTAAAALEHGIVSDIDAKGSAPVPYKLPLSTTTVRNDVQTQECVNGSLKAGLQWSCNNVFLDLADKLGTDKMRETAEKFGFNEKKLDIPVRAGESLYPKKLDRPQTALTGMGQGSLASTPLQIAMMTAGLANDGKVMKPYMVEELRGPDLGTLEKHKPELMSQAVSADTARKVQTMMENTAEKGTGKAALIDGVTVGAKTGTAQHGVNNEKLPYAWFVSYAKQGDGSPVAVAVFIDPEGSDIDREDISGGKLAGPIAKKVMEAALGK
ncbi:peptidoglycan D,D-transpeptidase FtsI family protein [Streptomyces albireticuli]|uniref:Penicillin-binding protein n=1 Tax=Streptomyces albireticuli TaxID=1940 RepID=A0A2A2DC24_9ACTN|nr:penicillin-binding transpeptidase domain-containing protein [Streptomyces albireticuli]MCD9142720.1 penicillin-binding protein 2 [Streptomyces albireticuli]MCD9162961.1 penicillin-binding protein 2 [Streptomyces albireticuli]MCD9192848.1 penicillin-binding protein 2 [Streptomyces albireticuli]PAU50023.1 penicillin-binding protein [Streptomyces albireticuli]